MYVISLNSDTGVKIRGMMYREAQGLEFLLARKGLRETADVCSRSSVMTEVEWVDSRGGRRSLKSRTRQKKRIMTMIEIGRPLEVSSRCS
jgi:hypothetical protein